MILLRVGKKNGDIVENIGSTLEDYGIVRTMAMCGSYAPAPLAVRAGDASVSWEARDGMDQEALPLLFTPMLMV
jgi:hypothetical protein